jgi:hypothetical protein
MKSPIEEIYKAESPLSQLSLQVLREMREDGLLREYEIKPGDSLTISASVSNDSFYLAYGDVDVIENNKVMRRLSDSDNKRMPVHLADFMNISFYSQEASALIRINQEYLDYYISWNTLHHVEPETEPAPEHSVKDILAHMRQPTIFISLPVENISRIIEKMYVVNVTKGTEVITEDDIADYFYIIARGEALVWQMDHDTGKEEQVNHLYAGNHFGQDALIVEGTKRNASVRMIQDSTLLVLDGKDFKKLIS